MAEKQIVFSNIAQDDPLIEEMMIACYEQLGWKVIVLDVHEETNDIPAPILIMCNQTNVEDMRIRKKLKEIYQAHQAVILYEPINNEVNRLYRTLEGKNYALAERKGHRQTLFGLKRCDAGITHILECYQKDGNAISEAMIDFLKEETQEMQLAQQRKAAAKALEESETNLAAVANQHVLTKRFTLAEKNLSLSYYIVSAHKYMGNQGDGGEDWFFIQQYGILNGKNGYVYDWAGANQEVNGEKYFVGDGDVCLNYVDYYMMQNYVKPATEESDFEVDLIYAEPEAINGKTTYTITESVSIGGAVGFEGGVDGGNPKAVGSGTFSMGAGFDSSYSFEVSDCSCEGTSLDEHDASASWKYSFQRAKQNRKAFHWQELHEPAALSRSVFKPCNSWVWKFPTNRRDDYKSFHSLFRIAIMNTISRYSGSQSPKHINTKFNENNQTKEYKETSFEVTLNMPPLLGVSTNDILLSKDAQTTSVPIISQGPWILRKKDADVKWLRISETSGSGGECNVKLSVDALTHGQERATILQLIKDQGCNDHEEMIEISVMQSSGSVENR